METHRQHPERVCASLERLKALRQLPLTERNRVLEAASASVASLYTEDLERPVHERELTAFTALDGEPVLETQNPVVEVEKADATVKIKLAHVA